MNARFRNIQEDENKAIVPGSDAVRMDKNNPAAGIFNSPACCLVYCDLNADRFTPDF